MNRYNDLGIKVTIAEMLMCILDIETIAMRFSRQSSRSGKSIAQQL
jgi:hypothetical protein